jgi:glycosyltransferase involved in cell wall biosynthesis
MKQIRVLHVVGVMDRGGVETWLLHVMRCIDRRKLQMDFLVHTTRTGAYDAELQSLGARIFPCPDTPHPLRYAKRFMEINGQSGPFDVIHSHLHGFSGFVMSLACGLRIPMRISHSHSCSSRVPGSRGQHAYRHASRWLISANCTHGLAASGPAADDLFGERWQSDPRFEVLPCGVDLAPFRQTVDRARVRSEFGFDNRNMVIGHVGRFDGPKNHDFLVDIAAQAVAQNSDARLLLVGDGPLRPVIEAKVRQLGLTRHVIFAGSRSDVPRLLLGAMDKFLFPSLHEGLGLALIEAQAAGLPCAISSEIPSEADLVPQLITRMPLENSPATWADRVLRIRPAGVPQALTRVENSPFNVVTSARKLANTYGA